MDPADLTARLIRCASVTPDAGEAIDRLARTLEDAGWTTRRADRGGVPNLIARRGPADAARVFGFNGHLDVVPPGDLAAWTHPPFSGHVDPEGTIWGRGATDMKSGVAAFASAASAVPLPADAAILMTVTGDEEGPSRDGTRAILDAMAEAGERMDVCLVGEPTCGARLGDMVKIGRRGSLTATLEARGVQGHAAYPDRARNPVHALVALLARLTARPLDDGTADFGPSGLQVTTVDVGNPASNVIPATAHAVLNIRFNDRHTGASLTDMLRAEADAVAAETGVAISVGVTISGEAFLTPRGAFTDLVAQAVQAATGIAPELSTTGGTSDARFIRAHCPVVEFGLVGRFMHQIDERVPAAEVRALAAAYGAILQAWLAADASPGGPAPRPAAQDSPEDISERKMPARIEVTDDLAACRALRRAVFIEEQGVSEADEVDDRDGEAVHLVARDSAGRPVGSARLLPEGVIGRVCVLPEARGTGLGAALIRAAVANLTARGVAPIRLGAQTHALGFYERLGFVAEGPVYDDAGIPHRKMIFRG